MGFDYDGQKLALSPFGKHTYFDGSVLGILFILSQTSNNVDFFFYTLAQRVSKRPWNFMFLKKCLLKHHLIMYFKQVYFILLNSRLRFEPVKI